VLAVVVALYVLATAAGTRQPSGGGGPGGLREGLPETLGRVLVLPAGRSDLVATSAACRPAGDLLVPPGGECRYDLKTAFLAKRLRLASADGVTAVLVQPKPKVTDTEALEGGAVVEFTYRQEGSTLTLSCPSSVKQPCRVGVR
jgi:hypothetical protein